MNIGSRIKNLRQKKKLTQKELADYLFVSDKVISNWESGRTEPNLELLVNLSEKLACSPSYLLYGDINKNDIETEIKIKLSKEEYKNLEIYFNNNAKFLNNIHHKDTYYEPRDNRFTDSERIAKWLRIGERGNKNILNYKNWYDDYCDEYEVEIDDVKTLEKIFTALNLEKIAVMNILKNMK